MDQPMMDGHMMSGGMMIGMGLIWILIVIACCFRSQP